MDDSPTTEKPAQARLTTLAGIPCVVLGGGGFIGTHLCRALVQSGAQVRGFGRSRISPDALTDVAWTSGEFSDRAALTRAIKGAEVVFHLLGGSTPESSNKDPLGDLTASTAATLQLLDICREADVRRLVFVSSGGTVYGIPRTVPIPETAPTDPISAYGVSKLATEKYLHLYRHLYGLDHTILRLANPFGPLQSPTRRQGLVTALMHCILRQQPVEIWGDGGVVRDFVYIDDAVDAILRAVTYQGPHHVFNVGSGVGRSVLQVVTDIGEILGTHYVNQVFKPARATDVPVNVLDIGLIGREFGWRPMTAWKDALGLTAAWVRSTGRFPEK